MEKLPTECRNTLARRLEDTLVAMNRIAARRLFHESGLCAVDFAESAVVPALERIGSAWEKGDVALSQVYMSGRLCEDLIDELLTGASTTPCDHPPMAVAVLNDSHLLGKRMVSSVLRASGYAPLDYGQAGVDDLAARVAQDGVRVLLVSTLMLPSALQVGELRERLDTLGLPVKLVVGGVPFRFDDGLWREVGADAMSPTASGVVAIVREFIGAAT